MGQETGVLDVAQEESLEGSAPVIGGEVTLEQAIDMAFRYRGNVTIVKADGSKVVGYIFNRNSEAREPFIQLFDEEGGGPYRLPYAAIKGIMFTGKDAAANKAWDAWLQRKEQKRVSAAQQDEGETHPASPEPSW